MPKVKIDTDSDSAVEMEIVFRQAQFGEYVVEIKQSDGTYLEVREGDNGDDVTDKFNLPLGPKELVGQRLDWRLLIRSFTNDPNNLYFAQVALRQKGKPLENGLFTYQGKLDEAKNIFDVARFIG